MAAGFSAALQESILLDPPFCKVERAVLARVPFPCTFFKKWTGYLGVSSVGGLDFPSASPFTSAASVP